MHGLYLEWVPASDHHDDKWCLVLRAYENHLRAGLVLARILRNSNGTWWICDAQGFDQKWANKCLNSRGNRSLENARDVVEIAIEDQVDDIARSLRGGAARRSTRRNERLIHMKLGTTPEQCEKYAVSSRGF